MALPAAFILWWLNGTLLSVCLSIAKIDCRDHGFCLVVSPVVPDNSILHTVSVSAVRIGTSGWGEVCVLILLLTWPAVLGATPGSVLGWAGSLLVMLGRPYGCQRWNTVLLCAQPSAHSLAHIKLRHSQSNFEDLGGISVRTLELWGSFASGDKRLGETRLSPALGLV